MSAAAAERVRPLPPVAAEVDAALMRMDGEIDWLMLLSPIHNDRLWSEFEASGRTRIPGFEYRECEVDLHAQRERLLALPMENVESHLLQGLLSEKQRELDRQLELVRLRGTDGFIGASIDLFGDVEPSLLSLAREILDQVPVAEPLDHDAGLDEVVAAAEADFAWYRERVPDFTSRIVVDDDLASLLMVSQGDLYIARDIRIPRARVQPLIQHEVGTHVVTRHNGRRQALKQLECGLAHYDPLQEGLAVLAEYLSGFLPPERLRILAARVIATDMALHDEDVPAIFHCLHDQHGLSTGDAFDVAVRARRGGCLTKDAVYLRGLRDLLAYLQEGGPFERLFVGKFALAHNVMLDRLIDEGWVREPELLPRYWSTPEANHRLARARTIPVSSLFQKEPAA